MNASANLRGRQDSHPAPAVPGSYGQAPKGFRLPATTRLGAVVLQVSHLERSLNFYGTVLGLKLLDQGNSWARLGSPEGRVLVELREHRGARPRSDGRTGLFHVAILLPDRGALGRFVLHLRDLGLQAGASDHWVSEALYLQDPDRLGIEVYCDRPRSSWLRRGRELEMTSDRLDLGSLVSEAGEEPWHGVPEGTVMGHVHLRVGDLDSAAGFFAEALGFDRMVWSYPGALFLGAGGYHHHLGTNVWGGPGAEPPGQDEARLLEWTVEVPEIGALDEVAGSLEDAGFAVTRHGSGESRSVTVADPWQTIVRIRAASV